MLLSINLVRATLFKNLRKRSLFRVAHVIKERSTLSDTPTLDKAVIHATQFRGGGTLHIRHNRLKVVYSAALRSGGYSP
jgi:hypothetical protein